MYKNLINNSLSLTACFVEPIWIDLLYKKMNLGG